MLYAITHLAICLGTGLAALALVLLVYGLVIQLVD